LTFSGSEAKASMIPTFAREIVDDFDAAREQFCEFVQE